MTLDHSSLAAGSDATYWDQETTLEGSFCSDGESRWNYVLSTSQSIWHTKEVLSSHFIKNQFCQPQNLVQLFLTDLLVLWAYDS